MLKTEALKTAYPKSDNLKYGFMCWEPNVHTDKVSMERQTAGSYTPAKVKLSSRVQSQNVFIE